MTNGGSRPRFVRLKITILKANNLKGADYKLRGPPTSDPYATAWVLDRPNTEIRTKVIRETINPVWNYHGVMDRCRHGEPIEFAVWDKDKVGTDDLLGRVMLDFDSFYPYGFEGTLTLEETGKKVSTIEVSIEVIPPEKDNAEDRCRCWVMIERAENLKGADFGGKSSDPYVQVRASGKKGIMRTKVIPKTTNPEWNEEDEVPGYELGDDLEFVVYDWDRGSEDDELGKLTLSATQFTPDGFRGTLPLKKKGNLTFAVELEMPLPPKQNDPAEHITSEHRNPAPFQLRCMDTGRTHRLACWTVVGRSARHLDPRYDLVLDSPGNEDVARTDHCLIKCWSGADPASWRARVYNFHQVGRGVGFGAGGGHSAGGTSVDNQPVVDEWGVELVPGSVLRFGVREMWVVEKAVLYQKSRVGEAAAARARINSTEEPGSIRELRVPSTACNNALQHCSDWDSLVRVVLEWCGEPDEPPCCDAIEVLDECGTRSGRWEALTLEEQEAFDMHAILREVRMGCTLRLRLSSDPYLLAPIIGKVEKHNKVMEELHTTRGAELFGGFG